MLRPGKQIAEAGNPTDSGIYFEALEPRLLFSGSPEGVVVDTDAAEAGQTTLSAEAVENFTYPEDEQISAFSVVESASSEELILSDDLPEDEVAAIQEAGETGDPVADAVSVEAAGATSDAEAEAIPESQTNPVAEDTVLGDGTATEETVGTDTLSDGDLPIGTDETLLNETLLAQSENAADATDSELVAAQSMDEETVVGVPRELVFINDDIADVDQLTEDLATQTTDGRDITVVTLDSTRDGIAQISAVLAESEDIDAVHFVSHGTDRAVKLGGTWIDSSTAEEHAPEITGWGEALTDEADLLFYGCNLAGGDAGRALLDMFRDLTDADVTASTDDTGHAAYGADWDLEYASGIIETSVAFSDQVLEDWDGLLAVPAITARETIDSDYDGQIDRIKITTDRNLDDDFSGLTMTVAGYAVTGYSSGIANDAVFYVNLTESGSADTDATPTVTVTANTTLSNKGGADNIGVDAGVAAADTAVPVMIARETADLDSDGYIDAIHVTFSEAIDDSTVIADDWDVAGVAGEAFVWNTNGDTADDADIYITFTDAVLDTTETPDLTYTPDGPADADVQDLAGNELGSTEYWWNAAWQNRTQITFDNAAQAENLTEFPVLVSLDASVVDFDKIEAGGADIRFIDRTTGAELNYEIEDWDDGAETATVWVNMPQIDGSSDTDFIWMYYNNAGAADNSSTSTWNADYEGVWHLNEATDAVNVDATGNTNDGTPVNSPTASTGKISGALDFSVSASARVEIPFDASLDLSTGVTPDWTISAWVQPNANFTDVDYPLIYSYGDYQASLGLNSRVGDASDDGQIETWLNDDNPSLQSDGTAVTVGSWNYVAVVYDSTDLTEGPDGTVYFYLNGAVVDSDPAVAVTQAGQVSWIGWESHYQDVFKGLIDEVRVSSAARSADWLAAQYASTNLSFNTYGAEQSVSAVHATIDAANDLPTVTPTVADLAYTENDGAVAVDGGITVTDTDDADLEGATIQITGNYVIAEDTLSFVDQNGITGTWTSATGTLTLAGTATKAEYQTALQSITYTNSSEDPDTTTRTVTFRVNDGDVDSAAETRDITIAAENDKPVVTPAVADLDYTEGEGPVLLDDAITVADVDNANIKGATIQITGNYVNGEDILSFVDQNGITGTWTPATGTLTLTGTATKAEYQTALQSITYTNGSEDPDTLDRTVAFTVTDESNLVSDAATRNIAVASANDNPVADDAAFTIAEDAANGTVVGTVTATDLDEDDTLAYSITAGNGDGIFAIDSATGTITIADSSKLDFEAAESHTLTVRVTDNGVGALTGTAAVTVTVTNINEAPVGEDAAVGVAENAANGTVVGTVTATDPDAADTLTYSITAGNEDGIFAIDSATGTITVADGSKLDYESVTTYTLTVAVTDAGELADTLTATVTVNGVNEEPALESRRFRIDENSAAGIRVGTVTATDPDIGDSLVYRIIAGNENGAFTIDPATGEITIQNSDALDFETCARFDLTIQVTDSGSLSKTATVTVDLNDVEEVMLVEEDPTAGTTDSGEFDDTASDTDTANDTDSDQGSEDAENSERDKGPAEDRARHEDEAVAETGEALEEAADTASEGSLSDIPEAGKSYEEESGTDKAERRERGTDTGGPAGEKGQKGGESEGDGKQAASLNPLSGANAGLFTGQKDMDRMSVQARRMISNTHMQNQLDALKEQIAREVKQQQGDVKFMVGTASGVTATAVAGYMLWMFRGVSLIASAIASLPVWGFFDPLPVLSRWEKTPATDDKPGEEIADEDEKRLDDIFQKKETSKALKDKKRRGKR